MNARYLLIVKVPRGLTVRNTPRPQSMGGIAMRNVAVGTSLEAYSIHNIDGVDYARLVPQNPQRPEWVRVAEADRSIVYVDVIDLGNTDPAADTAAALNRVADAILLLKS